MCSKATTLGGVGGDRKRIIKMYRSFFYVHYCYSIFMILWLTNSLEKPLKIHENGKIKYILSHKMHNVNTMQNMDPGNRQYPLDFDFQSFLLNHCEEIRKCS